MPGFSGLLLRSEADAQGVVKIIDKVDFPAALLEAFERAGEDALHDPVQRIFIVAGERISFLRGEGLIIQVDLPNLVAGRIEAKQIFIDPFHNFLDELQFFISVRSVSRFDGHG